MSPFQGRSRAERPRRIAWSMPVSRPLTMTAEPTLVSGKRATSNFCVARHKAAKGHAIFFSTDRRGAGGALPSGSKPGRASWEGSLHGPAWVTPSSLMGARVIGLGVPMGWEGCPRPSNGRPPHVGGHSLSLDPCPPPPEGCSRSTDGTILHGRSVTPSREGTHPYGMMGVSIRQDRRLRSRKDASLLARRTPVRAEGRSQVA